MKHIALLGDTWYAAADQTILSDNQCTIGFFGNSNARYEITELVVTTQSTTPVKIEIGLASSPPTGGNNLTEEKRAPSGAMFTTTAGLKEEAVASTTSKLYATAYIKSSTPFIYKPIDPRSRFTFQGEFFFVRFPTGATDTPSVRSYVVYSELQ